MSKKELGQFYTTNAKFIIGDLIDKIETKDIVDPFSGNWDLLNLFDSSYIKTGYDIDPKNEQTIKKNSLIDDINYEGKAVITNPPYLLNNKTKNSINISIFKNNPGLIDLYQISIKKIIGCSEGILIVPNNFWTSERAAKIRKLFLDVYKVEEVKMFMEQVFDDTDYSVCSFYFKKKNDSNKQNIKFRFIKNDGSESSINLDLSKENFYSISIDYMDDKDIEIDRVSRKDEPGSTNIFLRLTDSKAGIANICAEIKDVYIGNKAKDRSFMTLKLNKKIDEKEFVKYFNKELSELREKYFSMFLGNYRNGNRKKMTINDAFKFSKHIIVKYGLFRR